MSRDSPLASLEATQYNEKSTFNDKSQMTKKSPFENPLSAAKQSDKKETFKLNLK